MSRVSEAEVFELLPDVDSSASMDPFIAVATLLVDDELDDTDMSDDRLTQIELWLSAHFASVVYMKAAMEKAGPVTETVQYKVDLNFNVTVFGQQALLLDTSGKLALLQKKALGKVTITTPSLNWLGNPDEDLIDANT